MAMKRHGALLLLCGLLMGLSGCAVLLAGSAGAGIGVGTFSYIEGNLKRDYQAPLPEVWKATLEALDELEIPSTVENKDSFGGLIKGTMFDGTKVVVKLEERSDNLVEVGVRVGVLGDRGKAEVVHETIASIFKKKQVHSLKQH